MDATSEGRRLVCVWGEEEKRGEGSGWVWLIKEKEKYEERDWERERDMPAREEQSAEVEQTNLALL